MKGADRYIKEHNKSFKEHALMPYSYLSSTMDREYICWNRWFWISLKSISDIVKLFTLGTVSVNKVAELPLYSTWNITIEIYFRYDHKITKLEWIH